MARNQERNFGSDWRSDERYERPERDRRDQNFRERDTNRDFNRDLSGSDRYPEDYEQRRFSGSNRDDHHRGAFGDRDYTRDYALGTGTSMRMNRYESSQSGQQDRGFYGKGPKGWKRSDDRIKDEVCEALTDSYLVDASDIDVEVKDGHVSLSGTIESRQAKREVEHIVDGIRGVEDVQNNLKLARSENVSELRRAGTDSGKSSSLS